MIDKINVVDFEKGNLGKYVAVTDEGFAFNITKDEYKKLLDQAMVKEPLQLEREIAYIYTRSEKCFAKYKEGEVEISRKKYDKLYEEITEYSVPLN